MAKIQIDFKAYGTALSNEDAQAVADRFAVFVKSCKGYETLDVRGGQPVLALDAVAEPEVVQPVVVKAEPKPITAAAVAESPRKHR